MLDGWTDVFEVPGKRTTGTAAQTYAITGPGWTGTLPAGVKEYKSPTGMVWILGRIYCTGTPEDYKAVHALQDQMSAVPLSVVRQAVHAGARQGRSSIDMKTAVRDQVEQAGRAAYFKLLAELMKTIRRPPTMRRWWRSSRRSASCPGQDFDAAKLDPAVAKGIAGRAQARAREDHGLVQGSGWRRSTLQNGWLFTTKTGLYGTNYLQRALVTAIGLGANRPQDAVYPTSEADADGKPYDGANKYVMHFDKGQTPPVNGFWSLTMYNAEYFFVDNPLNRYTVSPRSEFKPNADGSIDIYIQNESPGKDKEANWLPAPKDKFILMMRLYWPKEKPRQSSTAPGRSRR